MIWLCAAYFVRLPTRRCAAWSETLGVASSCLRRQGSTPVSIMVARSDGRARELGEVGSSYAALYRLSRSGAGLHDYLYSRGIQCAELFRLHTLEPATVIDSPRRAGLEILTVKAKLATRVFRG